MHPEGINWIWEQSPAQSTRTDKHPPSLPSPSLPPFGTHTHRHMPPLFQSCLAEMSATPFIPLPPPHPDGSVCVPYPSHTHTHTRASAVLLPSGLQPLSWIQCFHGSHVFCTCRMRWSKRERRRPLLSIHWVPIDSLSAAAHLPTANTPVSCTHVHARSHSDRM